MPTGRWKGEARLTTTRLKTEAEEVAGHDCCCIIGFEDEVEFQGGGDVGGAFGPLYYVIISNIILHKALKEWVIGAGVTAPTNSTMYKYIPKAWIKGGWTFDLITRFLMDLYMYHLCLH